MADAKDMKLARHRDQLATLLRALGLNPAATPLEASINWDGDDTLYIEQYVLGSDGKPIYDAQQGDAKRELAAVTVETDVYAVAVQR